MDMENIDSLIKSNDDEIKKLQSKEKDSVYKDLSEEAKKSRIASYEEENKKLRAFKDDVAKITKDGEIDEKELRKLKEKYAKKHEKFIDFLTKNYVKSVNYRYSKTGKYFLISLGIVAGIMVLGGLVANIPGFAIASKIAAGMSWVITVNAIIRSGVAIINKIKNGDSYRPNLDKYNISDDTKKIKNKGSIKERIENLSLFRKNTKSTNDAIEIYGKDKKSVRAKPIEPKEVKEEKTEKEKTLEKVISKINDYYNKIGVLTDDDIEKMRELEANISLNKYTEDFSSDIKAKYNVLLEAIKDYKKVAPKKEETKEDRIDDKKDDTVLLSNKDYINLPESLQKYIINVIESWNKIGKPLSDIQKMELVSKVMQEYLLNKKEREQRINECKKRLYELTRKYSKEKINASNAHEYKNVLEELRDVLEQLNESERKEFDFLNSAINIDYESNGKMIDDIISSIDINNPDKKEVAKCMALVSSFTDYTLNEVAKYISKENISKFNLLTSKLGIEINLNAILMKTPIDEVEKILLKANSLDLTSAEEDLLRKSLPNVENIQLIAEEYNALKLPYHPMVPESVTKANRNKYLKIVELDKDLLQAYSIYVDKPIDGKTK